MRLYLFIIIVICSCYNCKNIKTLQGYKTTIQEDKLLDSIQHKTFNYFWEGAEKNSGLARERIHMDGIYPQNDENVITIGGTGFGLMAIVAAVNRGYITKSDAIGKLDKILNFLNKVPRFKGAWAHWYYGDTGLVKAFSDKDNGGDIVETAFLAQGLIVVREFFKDDNSSKLIAEKADKLWKTIEWNHYTDKSDVLFWHWSPNFGFRMNHAIRGFDECLIAYVLAAASPSFPITKTVFDVGWNRSGNIKSEIKKFQIPTVVKHNAIEGEVGPLFWSHYSFLGLNPFGLVHADIHYESVLVNHTYINLAYAERNPKNFKGYGQNKSWGLTASYSFNGYDAHHPDNDKGVISPTAALSSLPYTPKESISFAKYLMKNLKNQTWGKYGFYDAYSEEFNWFPERYLAIDQGPIVVMIENYRSKLIWNLFMNAPEIQSGLKKLEFQSPYLK